MSFNVGYVAIVYNQFMISYYLIRAEKGRD